MDNQNMMLVGLAVGVAVVVYLVQTGSAHSGRRGFPCYCPGQEAALVEAANNGDVQAQKMLAASVQGGVYTGTLADRMGPVAMLVGLAIVLFIVSRLGGFGRQAARPVTGFLEETLRGR
jgi:hypothetical protein